jgi:hypothetical protein
MHQKFFLKKPFFYWGARNVIKINKMIKKEKTIVKANSDHFLKINRKAKYL